MVPGQRTPRLRFGRRAVDSHLAGKAAVQMQVGAQAFAQHGTEQRQLRQIGLGRDLPRPGLGEPPAGLVRVFHRGRELRLHTAVGTVRQGDGLEVTGVEVRLDAKLAHLQCRVHGPPGVQIAAAAFDAQHAIGLRAELQTPFPAQGQPVGTRAGTPRGAVAVRRLAPRERLRTQAAEPAAGAQSGAVGRQHEILDARAGKVQLRGSEFDARRANDHGARCREARLERLAGTGLAQDAAPCALAPPALRAQIHLLFVRHRAAQRDGVFRQPSFDSERRGAHRQGRVVAKRVIRGIGVQGDQAVVAAAVAGCRLQLLDRVFAQSQVVGHHSCLDHRCAPGAADGDIRLQGAAHLRHQFIQRRRIDGDRKAATASAQTALRAEVCRTHVQPDIDSELLGRIELHPPVPGQGPAEGKTVAQLESHLAERPRPQLGVGAEVAADAGIDALDQQAGIEPGYGSLGAEALVSRQSQCPRQRRTARAERQRCPLDIDAVGRHAQVEDGARQHGAPAAQLGVRDTDPRVLLRPQRAVELQRPGTGVDRRGIHAIQAQFRLPAGRRAEPCRGRAAHASTHELDCQRAGAQAVAGEHDIGFRLAHRHLARVDPSRIAVDDVHAPGKALHGRLGLQIGPDLQFRARQSLAPRAQIDALDVGVQRFQRRLVEAADARARGPARLASRHLGHQREIEQRSVGAPLRAHRLRLQRRARLAPRRERKGLAAAQPPVERDGLPGEFEVTLRHLVTVGSEGNGGIQRTRGQLDGANAQPDFANAQSASRHRDRGRNRLGRHGRLAAGRHGDVDLARRKRYEIGSQRAQADAGQPSPQIDDVDCCAADLDAKPVKAEVPCQRALHAGGHQVDRRDAIGQPHQGLQPAGRRQQRANCRAEQGGAEQHPPRRAAPGRAALGRRSWRGRVSAHFNTRSQWKNGDATA